MEDEVKVTEMTVEEPVGAPTARQELETLLNELLPEEKRTGDVDQMALDWIRGQVDMNERLSEMLGKDPMIAQVFADVVNGQGGVASIVRRLGRGFIEAEEGTPEYEEMMNADKVYNEEREQLRKNQEEFDSKAGAFFTAFREYCEKNNLVYEEYIGKIMEKVMGPVMGWEASDEVFDRLVKAVDYEKDTEDAYAAGQISGRNMNIHEMRAKPSDGMPKGLSSQVAPVEQPRKRNRMLESALGA